MSRKRVTALAALGVVLLLLAAVGGWYMLATHRLEGGMARWRNPALRPDAAERVLPRLGESRATARGLAEIARRAAAAGDGAAADRAVVDILSLADDVQREGFLTAQLVAVSIRAMALEALAATHAEPRSTGEALSEAVAAIDQAHAIRQAAAAEAAYVVARRDAGLAPFWLAMTAIEEAEAVAAAAEVGYGGLRAFCDARAGTRSTWVAAVRASLQLQARAEMAEVALRLRAYRAANGAYPDSLAALSDVPDNPITGGDLAYRRVGDGFELRARGQPTEALAAWAWDVPDEVGGSE